MDETETAAAPEDVEASAPQLSGLTGVDVIKDNLKRLPGSPGVYRMLNAEGEVLYVGKARDLKKRVSSYAKLYGQSNRIARMIRATAQMHFVVTKTETEALLLEANLIKSLKPRFNVLLRDDKSFAEILIRTDHPSPQIMKHRGARSLKGHYFGPFVSAGAVNQTLDTLQKAFLLRSCSDSVYSNRSRACMLHQIKRCSAPCVGHISEPDYNKLVDDAVAFLSGRSAELQTRMAAEMNAASEALDFEKAARYRDRIRALASILQSQNINPQTFSDADVFALAMEGGQSCVQVFFFRAGLNWGDRAYFPRHQKDVEPAEILSAFLAQFYAEREAAPLVMVSEHLTEAPLLEEALAVRAGRKVEVCVPQRGEKRKILDQALVNAKQTLSRKMAESATQVRLLEAVAEAFGLEETPQRIEVYDNSHIQGAHAVGAMIVAGPEGFEKKNYRKFNIKSSTLTPGDDFGMMREVLQRRFARLLREAPEKAATDDEGGVDFSKSDDAGVWPDIVLIDGGEGQIGAVHEILDEMGLDRKVAVIGIAKGPDRDAGRERFFMRGKPPFQFEPNAPALYFLQRIRDEAHRFVIGAHRSKRSAAIVVNPLDEI
ncbi:MAG: excinuclease ABC subunit UvrC, partial [Caulobacterales bacterium]